MLKISIIAIVVALGNCGPSKQGAEIALQKNAPFTVTGAYFQEWVAGVREGGSGINVTVVLKETPPNVVLQSLYFRNKKSTLKAIAGYPLQYMAYFKNAPKPDIIMDGQAPKEAANTPPEPFPFNLRDNEAVVAYAVSGKLHFHKISPLAEKPMVAYPSARPDDGF
ncbi:MAG: hypothetical protein ACPG7E_07490 [Marinirhabdus sp.]